MGGTPYTNLATPALLQQHPYVYWPTTLLLHYFKPLDLPEYVQLLWKCINPHLFLYYDLSRNLSSQTSYWKFSNQYTIVLHDLRHLIPRRKGKLTVLSCKPRQLLHPGDNAIYEHSSWNQTLIASPIFSALPGSYHPFLKLKGFRCRINW